MSLSPPPPSSNRELSQAFSAAPGNKSRTRKSYPACESCGSRKRYVEDGRLYCHKGHLQEGYIQTEQDDDNFDGGLRSSQVTKQKKEAKEKVKKTLRGTDALGLYFTVYQLILLQLCRSLIDTKGLPNTLESLVNDLWRLRMTLVYERYQATRSSGDGETSDTTLYSSQTETDYTQDDEAGATDGDERRPAKVRKERDFPSLVDTLGMCYMACVILRVPLSIGTLYKWATQEEIPFLRPLRLVPPDMCHRLGPQWLPLLQTRAPLRPSKLYSSIHDLNALYQSHFDLELPNLNYGPMTHRYVTTLGLPIDLVLAVKELSSILGNTFSFPKPRRRTTFLDQPEIQLVTLLIIAVKVYYPFPGANSSHSLRTTGSINPDPTPGRLPLTWSAWLAAQKSLSEEIDSVLTSPSQPFKPGEQIHVTTEQVFSLTSAQTDSYLDWFEETWIDAVPRNGRQSADADSGSGGIMTEILNTFSPSRREAQQSSQPMNSKDNSNSAANRDAKIRALQDNAVKEIQSSIHSTLNPTEPEREPKLLPGENYIHHRKPSELGEPGTAARVFHEKLAELVGLGISDMLQATYKTERKLINWWMEERKNRNRRRATDSVPMDLG